VGGVDALLITISIVDPKQAYLGAVCAIGGSLAGSLILFSIARKGGQALLSKYTSTGRGLQLRTWFEKYGLITVFIPAISPIPMPMKIPVFCAGGLGVRWSYFIGVVLTARIIRYFALAYLGIRYGQQTIPFLRAHWQVVLAVVLVLAVTTITLLRLAQQRHRVSLT